MPLGMVPTVLALAGPTAAGKSELALDLAEEWGATILSADAMQVYRGLDIGTAKLPLEERRGIPHVGLDVVSPEEPFDARSFVDLAWPLLREGRPVLVAGGTSLYLQALQRGLVETPPVDPELRSQLMADGRAWERLREVDPDLAARLNPRDQVRVVRGLEVFLSSGLRLSVLQAAHQQAPDQVRVVGLWLDREDLDQRIQRRLLEMREAGYLEEVAGLLRAGVPRGAKPMRSLGYRYLTEHLLDGLPLEEAWRCTERDTRTFARKQRTWMRSLRFPRVQGNFAEAGRDAARRAFGEAVR